MARNSSRPTSHASIKHKLSFVRVVAQKFVPQRQRLHRRMDFVHAARIAEYRVFAKPVEYAAPRLCIYATLYAAQINRLAVHRRRICLFPNKQPRCHSLRNKELPNIAYLFRSAKNEKVPVDNFNRLPKICIQIERSTIRLCLIKVS